MPLVVKGTAHLYGVIAGVGSVTNATVVSFSLNKTHANTSETVNELGNKIEDRRDDLRTTGSITLKIRAAYVVAAAATQITYDSVIYLITSVDRAEAAQDFVTVTYNVEVCEYITLV